MGLIPRLSRPGTEGPYGVGDPDDKSLRKIEANVIIPQRRREMVREKYCAKELEAFNECAVHTNLMMVNYYCKGLKHIASECLDKWNDAEEVHKIAVDEYIRERTLYRQTGVDTETRKKLRNIIKENKEHNEQPQNSQSNFS